MVPLRVHQLKTSPATPQLNLSSTHILLLTMLSSKISVSLRLCSRYRLSLNKSGTAQGNYKTAVRGKQVVGELVGMVESVQGVCPHIRFNYNIESKALAYRRSTTSGLAMVPNTPFLQLSAHRQSEFL